MLPFVSEFFLSERKVLRNCCVSFKYSLFHKNILLDPGGLHPSEGSSSSSWKHGTETGLC